MVDKENKKTTKAAKKKKPASSKFLSIGKDQTVSILHGVGRVLNPKGNSYILKNVVFSYPFLISNNIKFKY